MDSKKGIILKVTKKGLVVLGKDGLFYRLPLPAQIPLIGEEVELPSGVQEPPVPRRKNLLFVPSRVRTWAMAASILIILVAGVFLFPSNPQAAYVVALDINPSLELYVDDEDQVIRAEALDREAEGLLERLKLKDLPLASAIEKITLEAKAEGLLSDEESRVIATVIQWKDGLDQEEIERKVEKQIANLGERDRIVVAYADKETLEQAHNRKLSVAKYKIAKELEEKGIPITKEEITKAPVGELLKKYGLNPAEVLKDQDPSDEKGGGKKKSTAEKNPGDDKPVPEEKENNKHNDHAISGRERDDEDRGIGKQWWAGYKSGSGEDKDRSYWKKEDDDDEKGKGFGEIRREFGDDEDSWDRGERGKSDHRDEDDRDNDDRDKDDREKKDEREKKDGNRGGERSGEKKSSGRDDRDHDDD